MGMKNKFRIVSFMLAAAMLLGACGSSSSSGSSESGAENTSSSAADESSKEEEKAEMLSLKPKQVINEETATFETLGADRQAAKDFEEKEAKKHKIPSIHVVTAPGDRVVSIDEYTSCVVDTFNCEEGQVLDGVSAGMKVRGNSSAFYGDVNQILKNQVPYRIKFDKKTNMLGLHDGQESKSWVLLKADWDLIRNDIAFRFARELINGHTFCSDAKLVYVYLNEEYKGIYLLCEQCQVGKNRVNITQPEEGYTGKDFGYYLELDNYATSDPDNIYITLDYGEYEVTDIEGETRKFVPAEYSVKNDVYTKQQVEFIERYLRGVFEIVYRACEKGEYYTFDESYELVKAEYDNAKDTVEAIMDIESVVDMYLLYEIVHDYDCGEGSFFMCVDFSENSEVKKLTFTSPWDFNWAYNDSTSRYWAGAFCDKSFAKSKGDRTNPWFVLLIKQDWFKALADEKWSALNAEGKIAQCIEDEKAYLELYKDDLNVEWGVDSANELFKWITARLRWMDKTFTVS